MLVLTTIGAASLWYLARHGRRRLGYLLLGTCLTLAAANYLLAALVTTTRERIASLTRETIRHVIAGDPASLGPLLRSDVVVYPFGITHDRLLDLVATSMRGIYAVKDVSILELVAVEDSPSAARSQVHLRVTPSQQIYAFPTASWWMLTWQRDRETGSWLISRIECQEIEGVGNLETIRP